MRFQHIQNDRRQEERSDGRFGFWFGDDQLAVYAADLLGDAKLAGIKVQVAPLQRQQLAAAQAGSQLNIEEVMPDGVLSALRHESLQLLVVQNTLGFALCHSVHLLWQPQHIPQLCAESYKNQKRMLRKFFRLRTGFEKSVARLFNGRRSFGRILY